MQDDYFSYRHVYHILSSKVAKVPNFSLLTIPQGIAIIAGLGVGIVSGNVILGALLVFGGFFALSMKQGEFTILRVYAILKTAVLIRLNRPRIASIDQAWATLQVVEDERPTAVYNLPGAAMVTGKE